MHDKSIPLPDVWRTCNKIRAAIFRSGLDLWEWFLPLDPNRDTLIPECKFVGVLAGPGLRSALALSAQEVSQLADYFRAHDGRVLYAQLCRLVHGEEPTRSEKPLADTASPSEHTAAGVAKDERKTAAAMAALNSQQARRVRTLLTTLAARQMPLQPYFQDYELVAQSDGGVTFPHFGRAISWTGVPLAPDDFALLVRCFIRDAYTVDYVRFLRALEAQRNGVDVVGAATTRAVTAVMKAAATTSSGAVAGDLDAVPLEQATLSRAAAAAAGAGTRGGGGGFGRAVTVPDLMHRIQKRVFQRRIRVAEWFRNLDPLNGGRVTRAQFARALDTIADGELTPAEVGCLAAHYTDPNDADRVCWRTFEDDCDRVFTTKELEKHPELDAKKTAANIRASAAGAPLDEQDECTLPTGTRHVVARRPPPRNPDETDILLILAKIKEKMVREGVRPLDFMQQYDLHNELVIPRADFYRGLASSGIALTPLEMDTLMEVFAAPGRRRLVEYSRFCETVCEALVQRGLERAPLLQPVPHAPPGPVPHLSLEERQAVSRALTQLATRPERASLLQDIFKEMDRSGSGHVSRAQAERALSSAGALHTVSTRERDALYKCFSGDGDSSDQVQYRTLCRSLEVLLAAR